MKGKAFCPGHATGFFEICDDFDDFKKIGSRGVGICLSKGVISMVDITPSNRQKITIYLNDEEKKADVSELAVKKIVGNKKYDIIVHSEIQLPIGQGFGMSGAGALSVSLALMSALGEIDRDEAVETAHFSEVESSTGLGDVAAQSVGGLIIREKAGIAPYGIVNKIFCEKEVVICVIGAPIKTKTILRNERYKKLINRYGSKCVDEMIKKPDLENFFDLSLKFAQKTGLMTKELRKAIEAAQRHGKATMAMLGNSIFAIGDTKKLIDVLENFGKIYVCEVDNEGARVIE
jgi:pantoate kinase